MSNVSKGIFTSIPFILVFLTGMKSLEAKGETKAVNAPITYSSMQVISKDDSASVIVEKAAKVLPRPNQTEWMRLEWTFFLHYGPNAFRGVEWGNGREEPSLFNPSAFDAE